jgi:hypothetical protein
MRLTFKTGPRYSGRARLPLTYDASINGRHVATLQRHGEAPWTGPDDAAKAWFWYGAGRNTASAPVTLDECKAQVKAFFSTWKEEK